MSSIHLENVEPQAWRADTLTLDVEPSQPKQENVFSTDYYEILRIGLQADDETIERVYRTLAERFHPDNPGTGDPETFVRIGEAYETLSDKAKRAKYNLTRQNAGSATRFQLRGREFFDGVRGGQNRRLAVLCLLYRQRIGTHESPGLTILDLEQLTGCTREELTSALWYLCEKQWAMSGEFSTYKITAEGFDVVESKLEDKMEFRALATVCYYNLPAEPEGSVYAGQGFFKNTLRLDTEPDPEGEGDAFSTDYYEVLGIGPRADEEAVERVYRTLAERFHPDNPATGDARTFQRIREAYETLSDRGRRQQYNDLRERTKYPERFRLRGREFFDGIRGEQLRRLAVLCLLYRQSASELPGLTVLDLEQLTGCTREELGSALWYLREKKWVKSGEFTEYSITAAGFDIVEKKLDEQEAARSRTWQTSEDTRGNDVVCLEVNAMHSAEPTEQNIPLRPQRLIAGALIEAGNGSPPPAVMAQIEETPATTGRTAEPGNHAPAQDPEAPEVRVVPDSPVARSRAPVRVDKRVILSMGGKGGVGKTSVMTGVAEWFDANQIPVSLLDLDIENKAKGSLTHFFGGRVPKINIHTPAGLDAFVDHLGEEAPVILADMGAGAGRITHDWFNKMYPDVSETGVAFTAIGVVTSDPASVESVLNWAEALEDRVSYIVVENNLTEHADFTYWRDNEQAEEFRKRFQPAIIRLDYRLADLENAARNFGVTLGQVAGRTTSVTELQKASLVMRAQSYRRRMFAEFDRVKELLLP
jgi:curved DNA-binding protein CbpA/MinD-like ATPase involved in chromosome partitioning or flagellar assembly